MDDESLATLYLIIGLVGTASLILVLAKWIP